MSSRLLRGPLLVLALLFVLSAAAVPAQAQIAQAETAGGDDGVAEAGAAAGAAVALDGRRPEGLHVRHVAVV